MLEQLTQRGVELHWMGGFPAADIDIVMMIPQFNEGGKAGFEDRLAYFALFARQYQGKLEVIIIDDGSTDDSLAKMIAYRNAHSASFYIASISPNAQKVGALYKTILNVNHSYIILSDFDTDIRNIEALLSDTTVLQHDADLMGCYFKMIPFDGAGNVFAFQQLEYALQRSMYTFHKKEGSVRVMPGAASCYKREAIVSIYAEHSGLRNGEDREATLLGLKMKYKTLYIDSVLAMTRPPLSFAALINQRIRWNLGYFETFKKEYAYYFKQMAKLNRFGIVTLVDIAVVVFILCLPFLILAIALLANIEKLMLFSISVYLVYAAWAARVLFRSDDRADKKMYNYRGVIFTFPLFKIVLDFCSWGGALIKFLRPGRSRYVMQGEVKPV